MYTKEFVERLVTILVFKWITDAELVRSMSEETVIKYIKEHIDIAYTDDEIVLKTDKDPRHKAITECIIQSLGDSVPL